MRCEHCQSLLLDHLYGLLDPADAARVEEHLAGCTECTGARVRAARTQDLFTRAARTEFPTVHFVPPADVKAAAVSVETASTNNQPVPSTLARPHAPARTGTWLRWAVAAGVLALIPGTMLPLAQMAGRYDTARRAAGESVARLADAQTAVEKANTTGPRDEAEKRYAQARVQHDRVVADWAAAAAGVDQARAEPKATVTVSRPLAAQPGAPNEFVVALADKNDTLRGKRVEAQVRDQTGGVVFSQRIAVRGAAQSVRLPVEVWSRVNPQAELYLSVAAVDDQTGTRTDIHDPIRLFGPVYATILVTDRASYRPGERVYFRSLTLDRVSFRPPAREQRLQFALVKPDGVLVPGTTVTGTTDIVRVADGAIEPVRGPDGNPLRGVGCGSLVLPADLPDGDYTLTLTELPGLGGVAPVMSFPVTRTVRVRAGAPERFAKTIGFTGASFVPGQRVDAWAELKLGDKPVPGAEVLRAVVVADDSSVAVRIDPQPIGPDGKPHPTTGADGRVQVRFVLPKSLPRGDVKLMVTFRADGVEESVAEQVPVVGEKVIVEFFPEGGKLIAGVPNRVYVRATTPAGKPVDVTGEIADGTAVVARVRSPADANEPGVNRGIGAVTFTPKAGAAYRLMLSAGGPGASPAGYELPRAEPDGVAMTVSDPVTKPGQPVRVLLHSAGKGRPLVVGAYTRGRLADTKKVTVGAGQASQVELLAGSDPRGGVTRITVFEQPADPKADLIPVAERLVFRKPGELLNLAANARNSGGPLAPGSPVELFVAATDEKGNPVPAILWAAVVNTAVSPGAKDRSLPTHFLLGGEVETPDDLEHADFLLTDHPKAATVLDHVLATQGWRRFAEQSGPGSVARGPAGPKAASPDRLLRVNGQQMVRTELGPTRDRRSLFEAYWPKYDAAARELDAAAGAKQAASRAHEPAMAKLLAAYEDTRQETTALTAAVRSAAEPMVAFRGWMSVVAGSLLVLAAVLCVVTLARWDGLRGAIPLLVAAVSAGGLALVLAIDSNRHPVTDVSPVAGPIEMPASDPEVTAPVPGSKWTPPDSPDPESPGPLAKGSTDKQAEKGFSASANDGNPKVGPAVAPAPRPKSVDGPESILPRDARRLIPDDLLSQSSPSRNPKRGGGPVHADSSVDDAKLADLAATFAEGRARTLAARMTTAVVRLNQPGRVLETEQRLVAGLARTPPLVVREYAAPRPGAGNPAEDGDTVLWQPVIVLPTEGKTTLTFHLGPGAGGYQVLVAGHTLDGRIGSVRTILSVMPTAPAAPK